MNAQLFRRGLVLTFAVALCLTLPVAAQEMTADEVIAKNLEARGGEDAIANMSSIRMTGNMVMGGGQMTAPLVMEWKRPNKFRMEFTMQGQTGMQAYDGEVGWMHMPFMGQAAPQRMPDELIDQARDQADFEGALVNYQEKGHTVEYKGVEEVDGTEAHVLEVTQKGGAVTTFYIDTEYFLEFKQHSKRTAQGQEMEVNLLYSDYKEVGGLVFPHSLEVQVAGAPAGAGQVMQIDNIEVNADLPDDRFSMPTEEGGEDGEGGDESGGEGGF